MTAIWRAIASTGERHIIGIGRIVTGNARTGRRFRCIFRSAKCSPAGTLFHRLRPRSDRTSADAGAASGTAIRTRPCFAPERDGRDGIRAGARTQSAACRDQQLHEGFAPAAGGQPRSQQVENRERPGPRRRAGASRRPDHSAAARFRLARGIGKARRKPFQTDRGSRRARTGRRPRAGRPASLQSRSDADLVLVDRVQIQQVLVNLFRNALEAMAHSPQRELIASNAQGCR